MRRLPARATRILASALMATAVAAVPGCGLAGAGASDATQTAASSSLSVVAAADLPPEARTTLTSIDRGGVFPFAQDGATFHNREGLLPVEPDGYYREFTVVTPGSPDRGARRIVAGEGGERYYTDDHYLSFREVTQ